MRPFGFVLTRCVRSPEHDKLWQHCVAQIRRFHSDPIVIIDDHSTLEYLSEIDCENLTIVPSREPPGRGELLPYYYLCKERWFSKAMILHDSMFLQANITHLLSSERPFQFLWHFQQHAFDDVTEEGQLLSAMENNEQLFALHRAKSNWHGCFGTAMVIDLDFLCALEAKHKWSRVLPLLVSRGLRSGLERVMAVLCIANYERLEDVSLFGGIFSYPWAFRLRLPEYASLTEEERSTRFKCAILKVWSGR